MIQEPKVGDIVYVINIARTGISPVEITGQKSKTIFYTQQVVPPNHLAQRGKSERKNSELFTLEDAKELLIKERTKAFEIEIARIKNFK